MPICRILDRTGKEHARRNLGNMTIGSEITVGRSSSCDLSLKLEGDRSISRMHLKVRRDGSLYHMVNLSKRGMYKDGHHYDELVLHPGDVVQFGGFFFLFGDKAHPSPYQLVWEDEDVLEDSAMLWPGGNTVGESPDSTICIQHPSVARTHARLTVKDDGVYIEEEEDAGGTYVEERPVRHGGKIDVGARLRFGAVNARLKQAPGTVQTASVTVPPWLYVLVGVVAVILVTVLLWVLSRST